MIRFFRENKSIRDTVIGIVAALFCISAFLGGSQGVRSGFSVGKRQIDPQRLHSQFQEIIKRHPNTDRKTLEQELVNSALNNLKQFEYIEKMGLQPTSKRMKQTLSELLPQNISLKDIAKEQHLNQNQLLLSIRDQVAYQQLLQSIESTSIVTPEQKKLHEGAIHQIRTYIDIDLSQGTYLDDEAAYKTLYKQHHFQHPKVYHYRYVNITPKTLKLPEISEQMITHYFQEHMNDYVDQNYEYQITTYIPNKTNQGTHKTWPKHIQKALEDFEKRHPNSRINTKTYHKKRSELPEEHKVIDMLKPSQHYVLSQDDTFSVITLQKKQSSGTLDLNLRPQLIADLEKSYYTHLLTEKISEISEYAYTHPKQLNELASQFDLEAIETQSEKSSDFEQWLEDEDFIEKHYISESTQVSELHYRFIQITNIVPPHSKSYTESINEIKSLYQNNVLFPSIASELNQATNLEEIKKICEKYKLSYQIYNTQDRPMESIFKLSPTRHNPHPNTLFENHWQQLQMIKQADSQENILPLVQKLDGEILLSSLKHATQD